MTNISIDLSKSNLPGSISDADFVQDALKKQIKEKIHACLSSSDINESSYRSDAGNNVFFIDGTRGAGKSTFMQHLVDHYSLEHDSNICSLPCIDPTKLPGSEPVLVTVIALLNCKVKEKLDSHAWDEEQKTKVLWEQSLYELSKGLQRLTADEYKPEFFDDSLQLHSQLDYSSGGQSLEMTFNKLLEIACNILKCKAIMLAFDDIDTQFVAGWDVLESIRRFFSSKYLIVLITGDLRLYSQLVRGKQYENYNEVLLREEGYEERKRERHQMVEHLEQQYLLKLFPVHKRFELKSLYQLERQVEGRKVLVKAEGEEAQPITRALESMVRDGLYVKNAKDLSVYVDELLQQPIRLVIQLLQRYYQDSKAKGSISPRVLNQALRSAMLSSIYKTGLTYNQSDENLGSLCKDVFQYTLLDGDLNTGFYLRPQSESESLRSSAIYLSSQVSCMGRNSLANTLQLLLTGCGSVSLFDDLQKSSEGQAFVKKDSQSLSDNFMTYMGLGRVESVTHWAHRACAVLGAVDKDKGKGVYTGLIRLNVRAHTGLTEFPRYQSEKELTPIARLSADISTSMIQGRNTNFYMSVFNLIAGISDLITEMEQYRDVESKEYEGALKKILSKLASQATCTSPIWLDAYDIDLDEETGSVDLSTDVDLSSAIALMKDWLSNVYDASTKINPSSVTIGKIWIRLFFNLTKVREQHASNLSFDGIDGKSTTNTNAAKIMRFNVLALLNAILFEESHYHISSKKSLFHEVNDRKNPTTSSDVFYKKLLKQWNSVSGSDEEKREGLKTSLPIFYSMLTCPLLQPFLLAKGSLTVGTKGHKHDTELTKLLMDIWGYGVLCPDLGDNLVIEPKLLEKSGEPKEVALQTLNSALITGTGPGFIAEKGRLSADD
ncbi:archaeal ATPase [Vibrio vulnificus]|uniref:archaeal ATPase n=1 Tax=Vibrio vulnificus TaxID=672 RepID=UPI001028FEA2|nr:archaeal ATPase [Vibrio vulnificus]EGQ8704448.1 archaeal ATPase [Vibrio parahaemolyticus]EGR3460817.1 archaeal ATPase [Vibrio parahaemolyticus]EJC7183348.1 hypothetical protein [Vibrio parahaemolyticus]EJG0060761.1 hypothetical protein [Vibrio parahaemolyticus]EJG0451303.1 hypothetical protein [Vibrio parahaemolyticus]